MIKTFKIDEDLNIRIDKYLKILFTALTQSFIEKNIRKKYILINNSKTKSNYILKKNDILTISNFHNDIFKNKIIYKKNKIIPTKILKDFEKSILYENNNFLILNKWYNISTQGGSNINISIDDIIKKISEDYKLVHRLDKHTSGLLIIAKTLYSAKKFGIMFKENLIKKTYLALCDGKPRLEESNVKLDIKNKLDKINKTETYYKVLDYRNGISFIYFKPKTGKTHQLRIVSKNLGSPIIGDNKYNPKSKYHIENLKLNAFNLKFNFDNQSYNFFSKLPNDFNLFIKKHKLKDSRKLLR